MRYLLTVLLVFFLYTSGLAATGEIIYQNCTNGNSCTGNNSGTGWTRSVVTSGCNTGSCLKLIGTYNPLPDGSVRYGAGSTPTPDVVASGLAGYDEVTISSWVKFTSVPSGANMKLFRPYTGNGSTYYGGVITPAPVTNDAKNSFYMAPQSGTMVNVADWFKLLVSTTNIDYPVNNGDGTYTLIPSKARLAGNFIAGSPTPIGTSWVEFTVYLKLPSTPSATDGHIKAWLGEELMYEIINSGYSSTLPTSSEFYRVTFYPSSEAHEPFEHWMDDMVIYEGYVPPGPQVPIDGECNNTYNGGTFTELSASDPICTIGAVGSFTPGPPTALWQCLGQSGGIAADCSATITPDTCQDNDALCTNLDDCLLYYPTNSFCVNDLVKCHPGDCVSVGSLTNFNLLTQEECGLQGLFYWDGVCNTVEQPTNLTTTNLITNPNLLDWTLILPDYYTSYIPGNISKTFLGARMFNGATLNPSYQLKPDTIYTAVYNLMTVTGSGKVWSYGFPDNYLSSAPGTIIHQFTTPPTMLDNKLYIGSSNESTIEANNFRLYESTKDIFVPPPGVANTIMIDVGSSTFTLE